MDIANGFYLLAFLVSSEFPCPAKAAPAGGLVGKLEDLVEGIEPWKINRTKVASIAGKVVDELVDLVEGIDPWTINQNICPPILCGQVADLQIMGETSLVAFDQVTSGPFPFFEGDIVLDASQKAKMNKKKSKKKKKKNLSGKSRRSKRAIVKPAADKHWRYGQVPFKIDQAFDDKSSEVIHRAHRHIERHTCIRFHERVRGDDDYLLYIYQPGCWSYVGRTGGSQTVSLGYGCEQMGTAVHETCHALGFWHEQSRADRDDYVEIIMDNVSPRGKMQFDKRSKSESFSLGYVYDYESIMHYGEKFFSNNGRDTIKLKGPGENMNLKIGQRRGLSELDMAQLNAMYHCNTKDQVDRVCGKDWEPYDGSCYKFMSSDNQTYNGARAACSQLGARLVHVTSSGINTFLNTVIQDHHADQKIWRIGAKKLGDNIMWEDPKGRRHRPLKYSAWVPDHPESYTTGVLSSSKDKHAVWKGTWAGSTSKPNKFAYPYICEKKDYKCTKGWVNWADKCYLFERDKLSFTRAHRKCTSRSGHLLHINSEEEDTFVKSYLIDNYPGSEKWRTGVNKKGSKVYWYDKDSKYKKIRYKSWAPNQPGKYANMALTRFDGSPKRFVWKGTSDLESNKLPFVCEKDAEANCFRSSTGNGRDYRGEVWYTEQGVSCQKWSSQYPQRHDYLTGNAARDRAEGLGEHNFCRNPYGRRARPWCYVPLKNTKWQYCDIAICK